MVNLPSKTLNSQVLFPPPFFVALSSAATAVLSQKCARLWGSMGSIMVKDDLCAIPRGGRLGAISHAPLHCPQMEEDFRHNYHRAKQKKMTLLLSDITRLPPELARIMASYSSLNDDINTLL